MPAHRRNSPRRRRIAPIAFAVTALASAGLSLALTGTLSGFVASITNDQNTAGTGTLTMEETGPAASGSGTQTCRSTDNTGNTATCSTINKFGANMNMVPAATANDGWSTPTSVTIKNTGSAAASSFLLAGGTCTPGNNSATSSHGTGDLCSVLNVRIKSTGAGGTPLTVFDGKASALATATMSSSTSPAFMPAPPAPGDAAGVVFTISVQVDPSAGNAYQGRTASMPLTWTFNS